MKLETELKLLIKMGDISKFLTHPLLHQHSLTPPVHKHLISYYFDTHDHCLLKHGYVLRIRYIDGHHLQTIKTTERSANGLHQRREWEKEIEGIEPDLSVLPDANLYQRLNAQNASKLDVIFKTEFKRTTWELVFSDSANIELALDIGKVYTDKRSADIQEIELELKKGEVDKLYEIRKKLEETIHLIPSDRSKAEMGFDLLEKK